MADTKTTCAIVPIPLVPWSVEVRKHRLAIHSVETDEVVFYMSADPELGEHQPTELVRAKFIVEAVNINVELKHLLKEIIALGWCMASAGTKNLFNADDSVRRAKEIIGD